MGVFAGDEAFEDGENLFAVFVDAIEIGAETALIVPGIGPFIDYFVRDIDVLTQRVERVAAQKEAVEEGRFAVRSQWIEIVACRHRWSLNDWMQLIARNLHGEKAILAILRGREQVGRCLMRCVVINQ